MRRRHRARGARAHADCSHVAMRPIYAGARIAGPAVTVSVPPGDNWMIHVAVEQFAKRATCSWSPRRRRATTAISASCSRHRCRRAASAGLMIDAGCRDVRSADRDAISGLASRRSARKARSRRSLGSVNVPVVCAGALVEPGDVVLADDDGVVVVRGGRTRTFVLESGEARSTKEAETRGGSRAASSASTSTACARKLADLGLKYV